MVNRTFTTSGQKMKIIGIIGYKKSGKTTLLVELARELKTRGRTVASVKSVSEHIDLPGTDTAKHREFTIQTVAVSPNETAIFYSESKKLDEILTYLNADYILIEGFKSEKTYPKIICTKPGESAESLMDGLEICLVSLEDKVDIKRIADLVEDKAFKLPGLNCKVCGYESCYELAREIVKGKNTVDDCKSLNPDVQITIGQKVLP